MTSGTSGATITSASRASFHPLAVRESDEEPGTFVVGRLESGEFVELPEIGVDVVRLLDSGLSVADVEERLAEGDDRPDVADLLGDLIELGWVATLDGRPLPDALPATTSHLTRLRPGHVRWLFSAPVAVGYLALLAVTVVTVFSSPGLLPSYRDFFWSDYIGLATLVNTLMFFAGALIHEVMHLAAARSLELPARIGLGTRLNNLALQTDVSAAWAVPRRQRYRIYLAGILWDSTAICVAVLVSAYAAPSAPVRGLLAAYVLVAAVSIVFQAQIYMRTDLYFVVADLLRCGNLFHDGLAYARYLLTRTVRSLRGRPAPPDPAAELSTRERRAVRIYAPLLVIGSVTALAAYALYGVPILVETTVRGFTALAALPSGGSVLRAVDGGLVLVVEWGLQVIFLVTFLRSHPTWFRWGTRRPGRR